MRLDFLSADWRSRGGDFDDQEVYSLRRYAKASEGFSYLFLKRALVEGGEQSLGRPTLLLGLNEKTISECTFRLRSLLSNRSLTARNIAARACTFEMIYMSRMC